MHESSREDDLDESESGIGRASDAAILARITTSEWRRSAAALDRPGDTAETFLPEAGVSRKIVCSRLALADDHFSAWAHELSAAGTHVRVTSGWIPDMTISDSQVAVISVDPTDPHSKPFWIEHPVVVSVLILVFDQAWNASVPLGQEPTGKPADGPRELVAAQRELLKLLAGGATDESAARHLGISLRTARRHMAALMSHLAATSRFQAGAEAAKRGWLG